MLEIDHGSQRQQWNNVLQVAERLPVGIYNVRCERNIVLALYHTGRLGDEMCRYNLRADGDLFYTPERHQDVGSHYQESRLLLDIGQVNEAEKCAYEALEISGRQPEVLQQLATISMVKGRPETARVFLNALAKQPFQRRAARERLQRLDEDPRLESDPRVSQIRANLVEQDRVVRYESLEALLQASLDQNPLNRMAFELLMAHYLGARRPDEVAANLPRLRDFHDAAVPRHYQEAWVISAGWPDRPPPIPDFGLDPQVVRDARQFRQLTAAADRPQDAAVTAWEAGLGASYFFFYTFGLSIR